MWTIMWGTVRWNSIYSVLLRTELFASSRDQQIGYLAQDVWVLLVRHQLQTEYSNHYFTKTLRCWTTFRLFGMLAGFWEQQKWCTEAVWVAFTIHRRSPKLAIMDTLFRNVSETLATSCMKWFQNWTILIVFQRKAWWICITLLVRNFQKNEREFWRTIVCHAFERRDINDINRSEGRYNSSKSLSSLIWFEHNMHTQGRESNMFRMWPGIHDDKYDFGHKIGDWIKVVCIRMTIFSNCHELCSGAQHTDFEVTEKFDSTYFMRVTRDERRSVLDFPSSRLYIWDNKNGLCNLTETLKFTKRSVPQNSNFEQCGHVTYAGLRSNSSMKSWFNRCN